MTRAQIWKKEGFEKGILKGKQIRQETEEKRCQEKETIVLNLLGLGVEKEKISNATGFSLKEIDAIVQKRH